MIVLPQKIKVKWHPSNRIWFEEKGYLFTRFKNEFEVNVLDLMPTSKYQINVLCDYCESIFLQTYGDFIRNKNTSNVKNDCCKKCKHLKLQDSMFSIYGVTNSMKLVENKDKVGNKLRLTEDQARINLKNKGFILVGNYLNAHEFIDYICISHPNEIRTGTYSSLMNQDGCFDCMREKISKLHRGKTKYNEDIISEMMTLRNFKLISIQYEEGNQEFRPEWLFYICLEHPNEGIQKIFIDNFISSCKSGTDNCKKCKSVNHPNYKKEITDDERIDRRSLYEYKSWRNKVFMRDDYTCYCCGQRGGRLNAHHLNGYDWCKERRFDPDNGITLCKNCHIDFHKIYGYGNNTKEQFEDYIVHD